MIDEGEHRRRAVFLEKALQRSKVRIIFALELLGIHEM